MGAAHATRDRSRPSMLERDLVPSPLVGFAILAILVITAYWPSLEGGQLWDDDRYLTSPALRPWSGLTRIWTEIGATPQFYPVTYSAFWVQHHVWGDRLVGYHAVNLALQTVNAFLLWRVLTRLSASGAFLAAALFAVHPFQVETVAWISELKNTLSGALYFASLWLYLRFDSLVDEAPRSRGPMRFYVGSLLLFVLAVLAKSVTASLPAVLLVIAWWRTGRVSWRRHVVPLAPFFAIAAGLGALTVWMEAHVVGARGDEYALSWLERTLLASRVVGFYLAKLLWPADLTFIYPRWEIDARDARAWMHVLAIGLIVCAAWLARSRFGRAPLAALAFFIGTLFPVLGFVNVYPFRYSYVADHFQYLACAGPIALCAAGIVRLPWSVAPAVAARVSPVSLLLILCVASHRQSTMYRDARTLWRATIQRNPECWMAYTNLGVLESDAGEWASAIANFERALVIRPDLAVTRYDLARTLERQGESARATTEYERAVAIDPGMYKAHGSLGRIALSRGRFDVALTHLERALAVEPRFAEAHDHLGLALGELGRSSEAIEHHRIAIALNPGFAVAHNNLGTALARAGDLSRAIECFERALALQPAFVDARANLESARSEARRAPAR